MATEWLKKSNKNNAQINIFHTHVTTEVKIYIECKTRFAKIKYEVKKNIFIYIY